MGLLAVLGVMTAACPATPEIADPTASSTSEGTNTDTEGKPGSDTGTSTSATAGSSTADGSSGSTDASATTEGSSDTTNDSSTGEPGTAVLDGRAEKGPLILGSTVVASPLAPDGMPTGAVFFGMIDDDLGSFSLELPVGLVGLMSEGFYFDEVAGELSTAPLSLRGTAVVPVGGGPSRVNVLTHLRDARALVLIETGTDPELALLQAADECVQALEIGANVIPAGAFDAMGIFGAGTLDDAYLLAVSATLIAATNGSPAQLQLLLNTLAADLADDGLIDPARLPDLRAGESAVEAATVLANLEAHALDVGFAWVAPPLDEVLDRDHDDVANALDNCVGVPNPLQEDGDGDGEGDACEDCSDPALPDPDNDGIRDPCDNCPTLRNVAQIDSDGDGVGNVCDPCSMTAGVAGPACCDPREPALWCMENDLAIQNTKCGIFGGGFGPGFVCNGIYFGSSGYLEDCLFTCAAGPCVPSGVLPVDPAPVSGYDCGPGDSCCTKVCTTILDDCGGVPDVHCIPWFAPGTAPPGLDDLGICVDTVVGPCAGAGAVASACSGATW